MRRAALILIAGLLGGAVIHVAGILAFPVFGGRDMWNDMERYGPEEVFNIIPQPVPGEESIAYLDPDMVHAVCRTRLSAGPHRVVASLNASFWSVGILDRRGHNLYSLNSETAGRDGLDLLLILPSDLTPLRRNPPPILEQSVVIDLAIDEAIVVIRAFAPDPSSRESIAADLAAADCNAPVDLSPEESTPVPVPASVPEAAP
jgi:uncharacterized membrane protein